MSAWALYPEVSREILSSSRASVGPPEPGAFSGIMSAVGRAFPAAYNEALSAITGIATEYGRAAAYTYGASAEESIELIGSPAPIADQYRAKAKNLIPDPLTTGAASRFIFDATRVLTKAAVTGGAGGVAGAALGTGALEGTFESQKLRDQGVDAMTAAKVGAIKALATGAGLALPIAGRTLLETAGLVVAGGPVTFMAEQAAARAVLEHADYSAVAHHYDPFDPMGLALSVAVPGMFGAVVHGARAVGAARAARAAAMSEEEVAAARVVQVAGHVDQTRLADPGNAQGADAHAEALSSARAQMDAGEPVNVADIVPASDVGAPGQAAAARLDAAAAREVAKAADIVLDPEARIRPGTPAADMDAAAVVARARQIVGAARFAEISSQVSTDARNFYDLTQRRAPSAEELAAEVEHAARQVVQQRGQVALQADVATRLEDPVIRSELLAMRGEAGWAEQGGRMLRDPMTGEVSGRSAWIPIAEWWPGRPDALTARQVRSAVDKAIAGDKLNAAEERTIKFMTDYAAERVKSEALEANDLELAGAGLHTTDRFDAAMVARAAELDEGHVERLAMEHGDNDAAFMRGIKEFLDEQGATVDPGGESGIAAQGARESGESGGGPAGERSAVEDAARSVVDEAPDLKVVDELTGEVVTAAELMRRAEEAYAIDARESDAFPAAVACFLSQGA